MGFWVCGWVYPRQKSFPEDGKNSQVWEQMPHVIPPKNYLQRKNMTEFQHLTSSFTEICNFEVNTIILFATLPLYYSQTSCGGSLSKWPGLKKLLTGQALSITALLKNNTNYFLPIFLQLLSVFKFFYTQLSEVSPFYFLEWLSM